MSDLKECPTCSREITDPQSKMSVHLALADDGRVMAAFESKDDALSRIGEGGATRVESWSVASAIMPANAPSGDMKIEDLIHAMRALATDVFRRCAPEDQARAEETAHGIVERANKEGLPAVSGVLIAAADMIERVARAMGREVVR